jgi:hypothetical protein
MSITRWDAAGIMRKLEAAATAGLVVVGQHVEKEMRGILGRNHGGIPSRPGSPPNSQTNFLRGQIRYEMRGPLEVAIGSGAFYGAVLETGMTILPKKKRLAIPLSKDAKAACRRGQRPANIILAARLDRDRPLRYIPTKGGDTLIVRDYRRSGLKRDNASGRWSRESMNTDMKGEPFFLLARAVKIDKRPWMVPAFIKAKPRLLGAFTRAANAAFGGAS